MSGSMAQYIADLLTSQCAADDNTADFVLRVDDDEIAYVDIEGSAVWLITIKEAKFVPAAASSLVTREGK